MFERSIQRVPSTAYALISRASPYITAALALAYIGSPAVALKNKKPADIQKEFAVGRPFPATPPTGKVIIITLSPDGSATAVPEGKKKGTKGTWRLSETGYCSTWAKGTEHCYTVRV